ncbi:MAG TPA: hypothetical protein DCY35_02420 [Prolixibacteraceae bacterium]|nr:hypothetical protein [Prolixibacteraceae bacterium]
MSTIHPEFISILSIRVYRAMVTSSEEFMENQVKPDGFEIKLGQNTALNIENKNVRIRLNVQIEAMKAETEPIGLSGDYGLEFQIRVENLEEFVTEKDGIMIIDRKLGNTLIGIVFSTARGIIFERTSSTFFNGVLLPVIDPNTLLYKK